MYHLEKMGQTEKNESHLEKWIPRALKKMQFEKWVILGKNVYWEKSVIWKNGSHQEKEGKKVTFWKMGHT